MWILKVAVCLTVPLLIAGQCPAGLEPVTDLPAPFLLEQDDQAVAVWSEVTSPLLGTTYIVREVYDAKTDRAFLEYHDGTQFQKLLFDRANGLFYSYTDNVCYLVKTSATAQFYSKTLLFRELGLRDVPSKGFLGPAAIFDRLSADTTLIAENKTGPCSIDRLVPCREFKTCDAQPSTFWYSKDGYLLFGKTASRPLRFLSKYDLVIEVMSIKTFKTSQDLFVPTGLPRADRGELSPTLPFDSKRRSFIGEVVMKIDNFEKLLVSKIEGLVIPLDDPAVAGNISGIYSFTTSTFRTDGDGDLKPDGQTKVIHDVEHNVLYNRFIRDDRDDHTLKQTKCAIQAATNYRLELEFPSYGTIDLRPIFLQAPVGQNISFLGANRIGSVDTEAYEVEYPNVETGNGVLLKSLIVTHHYANGKIAAVEINAFNQTNSRIFSGTIYINKYDNAVTQLNDKLRIDDCPDFDDKSETRWLEIGFEDASNGAETQILGSAAQIRDAFIEKLRADYDVDPMRLPQINVNFAEQTVLINALLLERPLLDMAFKDPLHKDFKSPDRVLGVMSLAACQISCLGMEDQQCTAISYCGATCSTSRDAKPTAASVTKDSEDCLVYERYFDERVNRVSSRILRDIQKDVTTPATEDSLRLKFATAAGDGSDGGSKNVEITAITYDDTKNFDNVFHFDKDKVAIIETSYKLVQPKRRFKTESNAKLLGSIQLEDCALACRNRQSCESFSFCRNSMECMISGDHDIPTDQLVEDNECVSYQKKYVDRFEKYPGLTIKSKGNAKIATNEESCAQKCVQDRTCKSFEFCDSTGDCLLLKTHIADANNVGNSGGEAKCSHYSKRFLFDYSTVANKEGRGGEESKLTRHSNITQATCAKLCSEWANSTQPCLSFDFCAPNPDNTGDCTLRTVDGKNPAESSTCNLLYLTVPPTVDIVKHGSGEAIGLSILMMLVGAGLAIGGLVLFNKYR